jgi:hypothetical protein
LAVLASANTFTDNQLISVNTSGNALEVRQIGAGNALVVEDDTNPDSTPFVVTASGQVGIGTTSPANPLQINAATNANLQVNGDASTAVVVQRASDDTSGGSFNLRKARGTTASRTAIATGDNIGTLTFTGYDGTANVTSSAIIGQAEGTISTGIVAGRILFNTANSSGVNTERMRINSSGNVGIGTSSPNAKLEIGSSTSVSDLRLSNNGGTTILNMYSTGSDIVFANVTATGTLQLRTNNTERMRIDSSGNVGIGGTPSSVRLFIVNGTASDTGLIVRGAASQTANLQSWQNSSGTVLASMNKDGKITTIIDGGSA